MPAEAAQIRLTDRVVTRLGTQDDMEANASSFLREMKEIAFALRTATNSSLVLIDELGRGCVRVVWGGWGCTVRSRW